LLNCALRFPDVLQLGIEKTDDTLITQLVWAFVCAHLVHAEFLAIQHCFTPFFVCIVVPMLGDSFYHLGRRKAPIERKISIGRRH
jgi:hypothetical protein